MQGHDTASGDARATISFLPFWICFVLLVATLLIVVSVL
jgi:hypothetical protein